MFTELNFSLLIVILFIMISIFYMFINISVYVYDSKTISRRNYMLVGVTLFVFSLFYALMTISENETLLRIYWAIGFIAGYMFYPLWMNFLSSLIEFKHKIVKHLIRGALILSIALSLTGVFSSDVSFVHTTFGNQFSYQNSITFNVIFIFSLILTGALLIMHLMWLRQAKQKHSRILITTITVSSIFLTPTILITELIIPIYTDQTVIPLGSVVLLPIAMYVFYSLWKYKLLGITVSNVSNYTFRSVNMPIYVLDYNDCVVIENDAAANCVGKSIAGKKLSEYIIVDGKIPEKNYFSENFKGEIVFLRAIDGIRICEMSLAVERDKYNDAVCKVIVFMDLTTIKEMEVSLKTALQDAIDANNIKSDFLAKMSHEIRTPMSAISGMTELILREITTETTREYAQTIWQASANLLSIINSLLDFSKIEKGTIEVQPIHYSLTSLLNDIDTIVRTQLLTNEVKLIISPTDNIPDVLYGDETKIRQVLINLLSNAVKHTKSGFISLTVSYEQSDADDTLDLIMIVEDTGRGIKQENIGSLFNEYYQVHSETDGVGLGLAITKGFVTAMGGNIEVESEYGKGSTFSVNLPQKTGDAGKLRKADRFPGNDTAINTYEKSFVFTAPGARVLIVDDIETNLKVVKGLLEPYKMTVDLCLSGIEAIVVAQSKQYDLIFMDYRMPDMDGMEATQHIRQLGQSDSYYSRLPIVALTANAFFGMREEFLKGGFTDYMSKPIDISELNNILLKHIPEDKHVYTGVDTGDVENTVSPDFIPSDIEGININNGIQLTGGKIEYYFDALISFHSDIQDRLDLLDKYVRDKNVNDYTTVVHALKSAGANVGAKEFSKLAEELETAGINNDLVFIEEKNGFFISTAKKLVESISPALEAYAAHNHAVAQNRADADPHSDEVIRKELEALKTALEDIDIGSINKTVDELMLLARTEDEKNSIREISQHILLFEYDEACVLIDKFYVHLG
jgi:signal transduction histidine kinase/ActR/RegA family two-component response regulator/HPt (histidine-containing phosphotransfer) domain-containing protein